MLRLFFSLYLLILVFFIAGTSFLETIYLLPYEKELKQDTEKDYTGLLLVISEFYPHLTQQEWQSLITRISEQSNTPLESRPFSQWSLDSEQISLLHAGEIVVADHEDDILFKKISEDTVLRVGPMHTIESVEALEQQVQWLLVFVLGITILLWASWQQYKVKHLMLATERYSEGKLESRAPQGFIGIPGLSTAFNAMAERIQRLFQSHKNLTNAVSHELRSPITRMRFQLEIFDDLKNRDEQENWLKELLENLDDMDFLVDEMLNYAKMERSEFYADHKKVELRQWLQDIKPSLAGEITKPLSLNLPDTTIYGDIDKFLLARLVRNLVTNANRYAKTTIEIGLAKKQNLVLLWVDDDGPGIPVDQRDNLFEPFVRLDKSRSRDTGGYGLGLAIAAQIARCHAGHITIETSPLGGARFAVTF